MRNLILVLFTSFGFVTPGITQTISTGTITGSPFCPGAAISVSYSITGTFNQGNIFTAQLSDANGSFSSPVIIGTLESVAAGDIAASLPVAQTQGTLYRIRVLASNPSVTGSINGADLIVTATNTPVTIHTKTWMGGAGNWNNPSNWSPCGVPNGASNIVAGANANINIPTGITASILRVALSNGAKLAISSGATLNVNGTQLNGIQLTDANTSIINNGIINCGNFLSNIMGGIGLFTGSSLTNNQGATITINDITSNVSGEGYAFALSGSSFLNAGTLQIGNSKSISRSGLIVSNSQVNNLLSGVIEINRIVTLNGISASGAGSFSNLGYIKMGNLAAISQSGIGVSSTFQLTNGSSGTIEVNNITNGDGISVSLLGSKITNNGTIRIGNTSPVYRYGIGLFNSGAFENSNTGAIEIDNITSNVVDLGRGLALNSSSSFTNAGSLKIGKTTAVYRSCLFIGSGQFINQSTGMIELNRTTFLDGITANGTGSLNNSGSIKIGNLAPIAQIGINMNNGFQFVNQQGATVEINAVPIYPAWYVNGSVTLINNSGSIKIGNLTLLSDGMVLDAGGNCTNQANAMVEIDNANGATSGCLSITGTSSAFTNSGTLNIGKHAAFSRRGIDLLAAGKFQNQATGTVEIFNETVKDNNFKAVSLQGASSQFNQAGTMKIYLKAPVMDSHGIFVAASSSFNSQTGSDLQLIINQ